MPDRTKFDEFVDLIKSGKNHEAAIALQWLAPHAARSFVDNLTALERQILPRFYVQEGDVPGSLFPLFSKAFFIMDRNASHLTYARQAAFSSQVAAHQYCDWLNEPDGNS